MKTKDKKEEKTTKKNIFDKILDKLLGALFLMDDDSQIYTRPGIKINHTLWRTYDLLCKKNKVSSIEETEGWLHNRLKREILKKVGEKQLRKLLTTSEFNEIKTIFRR